MTNEYSIDGITLRQRIEAMPEDCILFRSDFPEYHTEFVGSILSELTTEGMLVKIAHGIYAKPRNLVLYCPQLIKWYRQLLLEIMQRYCHLV